LALAIGATAYADDFSMTPDAAQDALEEGERVESQLTDPKAAEELPHRDLDRGQVLQLISAVFGIQLEGVAGVFNDLDVDHFLSDNAAVIEAGDQPEASGVVIGDGDYDGPALIESTVPLRTEDQSGEEATVDLGLEHAQGEIQPAAPLVEVGIPSDLGEGIDLPESEVGIELVGAPEGRAPSIVDETVAVYPEVAEDTSFAVAPSPSGVETFTLLQSPDAPNSATYQLSLPEGADLSASPDGGAEVSSGDDTILRVRPPAALDATGKAVPVSLEVSGDSFTVRAEPQENTAYPILVDPVIESYKWYGTGAFTGINEWLAKSNNQGILSDYHSALWQPGLDLRAVKGFTLPYNAEARWSYFVPRYASDLANFGAAPTSFVSSMTVTNMFFVTGSDNALYPMMAMGIWNNSTNNWMNAWGHGGNTGNIENLATTYTFSTTNQDAKEAVSNVLWAGEQHTMTSDRETYVGAATVELADKVVPGIGGFSPPTKWVNETTPGIPFAMSDNGLGVYEIAAGELTKSGGKVWTTKQGCIGIVSSPCPRTWSEDGSTSWLKLLKPSELPQGINKLQVVARDPVNNSSAPYEFSLKVDHTAPSVALSGTMTEQASLGTKRPSYVLTTTNKDGTEADPQSGVASTEITVDGKKVDSSAAGCATQNCSFARSWTLESNAYSVGKHVVVAKATDAVGLTTEKTINIEIQKDTIAPTITSTGGLENAPSGWVEQKSYKLGVSATDAEYGVTSLEFKMDGKVVKSTTASCPKGACSLGMSEVSVSMAGYAGGAHTAEYLAKDGAGNVAKKVWTVNVDPSGAVSTAEAINTMEAVEETTGATPVAPSSEVVDPGEFSEGENPALESLEGELVSVGTAAKTTMTTNPNDGIVIEGAKDSVTFTPTGSSGATSEVTAEVAAVSTGASVDTVTRPLYNGDQTFKVIRDEGAPETYSWKVSLNEDQTLKPIDAEHVGIFYADESQALLIRAEDAHDATGKAVPTSLSVSEGNVLTLTVKYKGKGYVYPILAGPAFESSYTLPVIWEPPPESEPSQESEAFLEVSAPRPVGKGDDFDATASNLPTFEVDFTSWQCEKVPPLVPSGYGCANWEQDIKGHFYYNFHRYVWWRTKDAAPTCPHDMGPGYDIDTESCGWAGPNHQKWGGGYHITAQVFFDVVLLVKPIVHSHAMTVRIFANGHVHEHPDEWCICNPSTAGK
jgi:hypothetical protein